MANRFIKARLFETTRTIMEVHSSDPEICGLGCEVLAKVLAFVNSNYNNVFNADKITHDMIILKRSTKNGLEGRG